MREILGGGLFRWGGAANSRNRADSSSEEGDSPADFCHSIRPAGELVRSEIRRSPLQILTLQAAGAHTLIGVQDDQIRNCLGVIRDSGVQAMADRRLGLLRADSPSPDP